jgi:hypothetical protein
VQVNPIDCAYVAETLAKVLDQDHWSAELTLSRSDLRLDERCKAVPDREVDLLA